MSLKENQVSAWALEWLERWAWETGSRSGRVPWRRMLAAWQWWGRQVRNSGTSVPSCPPLLGFEAGGQHRQGTVLHYRQFGGEEEHWIRKGLNAGSAFGLLYLGKSFSLCYLPYEMGVGAALDQPFSKVSPEVLLNVC